MVAGKKRDADQSCLVVERAKFAKHVMVSVIIWHVLVHPRQG